MIKDFLFKKKNDVSEDTPELKTTNMEQNQETVPEQDIKPTFDPNKEYEWTDSVEIMLNAKDFNLVFNATAILLGNPISLYSLKLLESSYSILQNKLKEAVESGKATERIPKQ